MLPQADWQNRGVLRRLWPTRNGNRRCAMTQFDHEAIPRRFRMKSPDVLSRAVDDCRMQVVVGFRAHARQTSLLFDRQILIEKCERDGRSMLGEGFRADLPDILFLSCFSHSRRQITEHLPAPAFDHALRHLQDRGEDAAHAPIVVPNRAVRKGEMTFLEVVVTVDREHLAGEVAGLLTVRHNPVELWSQEIPCLGEHLAYRAA